MDFFARQDHARRRTAWLVAYFALSVALTVVAVYLLVTAIFLRPEDPLTWSRGTWLWQPKPFAVVAAVTLSVIGVGSLYRLMELKSGGRVVAESLGGLRLPSEPRDAAERRLRNVVEEMALASGVPVPEIYILPNEQAINAFAAGHTTDDAVIGVTRGCARLLSRDELQGVIAHEFSHILNGDMRLNIRLMGVLFGLLGLATIGRILLHARGERNPLPLLGLGLLAIGAIGILFGRLIKSAISRQREFLADAAAVQFTRNPGGLSGALKKIGGFAEGSRIRTPRAEEAGHLLFANGLRAGWSRLFATHPPLADRIQALDSSFTGTIEPFSPPLEEVPDAAVSALYGSAKPPGRPPRLSPEHWVEHAGQIDPSVIQRAARWRDSMPPVIRKALRTPHEAVEVILALLLSREPAHRRAQLKKIEQRLDATAAENVERWAQPLATLPEGARLPTADLCLPALRELSPSDYESFQELTQALIEQDRQIDLLEYALQKSLHRHLAGRFGEPRKARVRHRSLRPVATQCQTLLSVLSHVASSEPDAARQAFLEGAAALNLPRGTLAWQEHGAAGLTDVEKALPELNAVAPLHKRNLLYACARTVLADRQAHPREVELLRAVADSLDCPVPPILPS